MGVGKWELNSELHLSLGTSCRRRVDGQWSKNGEFAVGVGRWELNAAGSRSPRQLRVYDGD